MSRRLLPTHCRVPSVSDNNPYQPTTIQAPHTCTHQREPSIHQPKHYHRNGYPPTDLPSDDTFTDSQSYYDQYHHVYHGQEQRFVATRSFSDDSGSVRLPYYYENDDESSRRASRNAHVPDRGSTRRTKDKGNPAVHKDVRKVYPQQYVGAGEYQEVPPQAVCENVPKRPPPSERPQSSMSSGVTSAIVDGCGGKCQTFENVCYFILQLVFMMGILIGVSLCIAGLVLRKSAARNLQVLVYIGAMLAIVSCLLLGIQWHSRSVAKKRKMTVRGGAGRAPIPLEPLRSHVQPLMAVPDVQRVQRLPDQQGVPWWRRKDLS